MISLRARELRDLSRRRARAAARRHAEGAVQHPLPVGDRCAREHDAAAATRREIARILTIQTSTPRHGARREMADETRHRGARPRRARGGRRPRRPSPRRPEAGRRRSRRGSRRARGCRREADAAEPEAEASRRGARGREPEAAEPAAARARGRGRRGCAEPAARSRRPKQEAQARFRARTATSTRSRRAKAAPSASRSSRTAKPETELGRRQERRGVVVSDKGDKTIVVKVDVIRIHPKYKKVVRRTSKLHAHDEGNSAGDRRRRPHRRDAAALEDEALAPRRDRGEGANR